MQTTYMKIDDSVRVVQLGCACAAAGLELATVNGELVIRAQPERALAIGFATLDDRQLLERLRASYVAATPVVREVARRLETYMQRQAEVDAELARWEQREHPPTEAECADVRAAMAESRESLNEALNMLGAAGAVEAGQLEALDAGAIEVVA
jgi:hypothetical protein